MSYYNVRNSKGQFCKQTVVTLDNLELKRVKQHLTEMKEKYCCSTDEPSEKCCFSKKVNLSNLESVAIINKTGRPEDTKVYLPSGEELKGVVCVQWYVGEDVDEKAVCYMTSEATITVSNPVVVTKVNDPIFVDE